MEDAMTPQRKRDIGVGLCIAAVVLIYALASWVAYVK